MARVLTSRGTRACSVPPSRGGARRAFCAVSEARRMHCSCREPRCDEVLCPIACALRGGSAREAALHAVRGGRGEPEWFGCRARVRGLGQKGRRAEGECLGAPRSGTPMGTRLRSHARSRSALRGPDTSHGTSRGSEQHRTQPQDETGAAIAIFGRGRLSRRTRRTGWFGCRVRVRGLGQKGRRAEGQKGRRGRRAEGAEGAEG